MEEAAAVQKDIEDLTEKVKKWQDNCTVASNQNDPDTLSMGLMELARVNSGLSRRAKYAMYIARTAEHSYKAAREQYKLDAMAAGKSGTFGDTQRYTRSGPDHKVWVEALLIAEQADDLAYRTDTFLKIAQSRLSLIKNDIARG